MRIRRLFLVLALGAVGPACDDDSSGGGTPAPSGEGEGEAPGEQVDGGEGEAAQGGEGEAPQGGEGEGDPGEGEGEPPTPAPDGCVEDDAGPLAGVACDGTVVIPGLSAAVQVVYDQIGMAHIYGANRVDAARVHGYVAARDRWFGMELARRSSRGELSGLLSTLALSRAVFDRTIGKRATGERTLAEAVTPEVRAVIDSYAAGINAFIDDAVAVKVAQPSELDILTVGTGESLAQLMPKWTAEDVVAVGIEVIYQEGWDTEDMGRGRAWANRDKWALDDAGDPLPKHELRMQAAEHDVLRSFAPVVPIAQHGAPAHKAHRGSTILAPRGLPPGLDGAVGRFLERSQRFMPEGQDRGSNTWAVSGAVGADGAAWLANDPHLAFQAPTFFYLVHTDTELRHDGTDEPLQASGVTIPGLPVPVGGHTQDVAWGLTRLYGDLQDFYVEDITLGEDGRPASTMGLDGPQDLVGIDETYDVIGFVLTGVQRHQCTIRRYATATGRLLMVLEGDEVDAPADCSDPTAVNVAGEWIAPRDVDGDGHIQGVSMDFTALDPNAVFEVLNGFFAAGNVDEAMAEEKHAVTFNNSKAFADSGGKVGASGFQALPLRSYLRDPDTGGWAEGSSPVFLLDGATHLDFEFDLDDDLHLITDSADPRKQAVSWEDNPRTSTDEGIVVVANNDLNGGSFDNDSGNDEVYVGPAYSLGLRASRIDQRLQEYIDADTPIGFEEMASVQADHRSNLAARFLDSMLGAIVPLEGDACGDEGLPDAVARLEAWQSEPWASSGVETFYHSGVDEAERDNAVATTIFNVWLSVTLDHVLGDEGLQHVHSNQGRDLARIRLFTQMVEAPFDMAGWDEVAQDHVYWDDTTTPDVTETAREILCGALREALAVLRSEVDGGFGTDDMSRWLWGLRHTATFMHPIDEILGRDEAAAPLTTAYSIKPSNMPVADDLGDPAEDPRASLTGYPRPGDMYNVDAAHPGFGRPDQADFTGGPVQRFIVKMGADGPEAWNILPGGQSSQLGDPHWSDQSRLWLGNEYAKLPWTTAEVAEQGERRVVFMPAPQ